jgi:membrane protein
MNDNLNQNNEISGLDKLITNDQQSSIQNFESTRQPLPERQASYEFPVQQQNNSSPINNEQPNIQSSEITSPPTKKPEKKKLKWWIPLILFLLSIVFQTVSMVITIVLSADERGISPNEGIVFLKKLLSTLSILSNLLIIPSIILVIIMYNITTPEEKKENINNINNKINGTASLDEKLLNIYIGNNYEKIIKEKFSIPALFLQYFYVFYRKVYILGIIYTILITITPSSLVYIWIIVGIFLGVFFNKLYISYAKNRINKIKEENKNLSENELLNLCKQKGGTSILSAILIPLAIAYVIRIIMISI